MSLKDIVNFIGDHLRAADFPIQGSMKVGDLVKSFNSNFGLKLRVYHGAKFAPEGKTLQEISTKKRKKLDDVVTLRAVTTAKEVTTIFEDEFGIKVKVADGKDDKLLPEHVSLGDGVRGEYTPRKK